MKVTAKALRTRTREILECLARGEPVTITYRGKARARLVNIDDYEKVAANDTDKFPAFGMWSDRGELSDVADYVRHIREGRIHVD